MKDLSVFFNRWIDIGNVALSALILYAGLVFLLRISGNRTLSKMNSFDFVVTIALGSILASTLLNKDTSVAEGFVALAVLIFLQYVITTISVRWPRFQTLIKSEPVLLYYRGAFIDSALRRTRITREEIGSAARLEGKTSMDQVDAVVIETAGDLAILAHGEAGPMHLLAPLENVPSGDAPGDPRDDLRL